MSKNKNRPLPPLPYENLPISADEEQRPLSCALKSPLAWRPDMARNAISPKQLTVVSTSVSPSVCSTPVAERRRVPKMGTFVRPGTQNSSVVLTPKLSTHKENSLKLSNDSAPNSKSSSSDDHVEAYAYTSIFVETTKPSQLDMHRPRISNNLDADSANEKDYSTWPLFRTMSSSLPRDKSSKKSPHTDTSGDSDRITKTHQPRRKKLPETKLNSPTPQLKELNPGERLQGFQAALMEDKDLATLGKMKLVRLCQTSWSVKSRPDGSRYLVRRRRRHSANHNEANHKTHASIIPNEIGQVNLSATSHHAHKRLSQLTDRHGRDLLPITHSTPGTPSRRHMELSRISPTRHQLGPLASSNSENSDSEPQAPTNPPPILTTRRRQRRPPTTSNTTSTPSVPSSNNQPEAKCSQSRLVTMLVV